MTSKSAAFFSRTCAGIEIVCVDSPNICETDGVLVDGSPPLAPAMGNSTVGRAAGGACLRGGRRRGKRGVERGRPLTPPPPAPPKIRDKNAAEPPAGHGSLGLFSLATLVSRSPCGHQSPRPGRQTHVSPDSLSLGSISVLAAVRSLCLSSRSLHAITNLTVTPLGDSRHPPGLWDACGTPNRRERPRP